MSNYDAVQRALGEGAQPAMLCTTCPWDRNCVTPPTMTTAEVEKAIEEAAARDDKRAKHNQAQGRPAELPVSSLLTAVAVGGRDTSCQICPVLAVRLRTSDGGKIANSVKDLMQSWQQDD